MLAKSDRSQAKMGNAATIAQRLVIREEARTRSRMLAYSNVAAQVGRSASWLRALISNSVSRVDSAIRDRLQALLISELEAEITRLTHELHMARQSGAPLAGEQVSEIETYLAKAHALLNGAPMP